jgi:hopanoid-associated phosphorylase
VRIGVIVGLKSEAACLPRDPDRLLVRITGARTDAATAQATELIDAGCAGLVSFGTAGGLDPALAPGTLVVAEAVRMPGGTSIATDNAWRQRLLDGLGAHQVPVATGDVAAAHEPLLSPRLKHFCFLSTSALTVDMESGAVAEVASQKGVPFLVVRALTDAADRAIPMWVADLVTPDGGTPIGPVIRGLLKNLGDLKTLLQLRRDAKAAFGALRRGALAAGPLFHFDR